MFDPSLLLSLHVFLLAISFGHRAFKSEYLNDNPHWLCELQIYSDVNELPLPIKAHLADGKVSHSLSGCAINS